MLHLLLNTLTRLLWPFPQLQLILELHDLNLDKNTIKEKWSKLFQ